MSTGRSRRCPQTHRREDEQGEHRRAQQPADHHHCQRPPDLRPAQIQLRLNRQEWTDWP